MAPIILELRRHANRCRSLVCVTGQHRRMLDQVLELFQIEPDFDLNLMRPNQTLGALTSRLFERLTDLVERVKPDWIVAQGDTTTVFVAGMVAFYQRIRFAHVEAGLRTGDRTQPFPEEINRRIADLIADLYFAPTTRARDALLAEGCRREDILVTGNTVVDAVLDVARRPFDWQHSALRKIPRDGRIVLITAHRRENFGRPFCNVCTAISRLAQSFADDGVHFVYPVHLNPNTRGPALRLLGGRKNLTLLEPLDYQSLVQVMMHSSLILTDSGGIQEEAPAFGVPVLVLRNTTERPEGVDAGVARLVGTSPRRIVVEATRVLRALPVQRLPLADNPYGDGRAARRIVSALLKGTAIR
jgi:UDP-N-acetylglucosamine 2-epimerase